MISREPPPGVDERVCKGCGRRIWWVTTTAGARIPLDPSPPVYGPCDTPLTAQWCRLPDAKVSHFATCPKANRFSGSKKRDASPPRLGDAGEKKESG